MTSSTYRPEIDGLRALSVSIVILYHAQVALGGYHIFPGGYIGVDVFFVISGYLITSLIYPELLNNSFSILAFYERRARRILPALFTVLICASGAAWYITLPDATVDFAHSLVASTLFSANIYFWKYTGLYAADANANLPLLHMWSLAVEEQFYILYPPALLLATKLFHKNKLFWIILVSILGSLALSEWSSHHYISANFYLMPTRAWELLCGAVVALYRPLGTTGKPASAYSQALTFLPSLGLTSIVLFATLGDDSTRHPSLITLVPVTGAMCILWFSNPKDPAYRILTLKPVVYTGLISYSLYLWHQPMFAFFRLSNEGQPTIGETLLLIAITLLLSFATYLFVECPTRNRKRIGNRAIWGITVLGSALLIAVGIFGIARDGFPNRNVFFKDMVAEDNRLKEAKEMDFSINNRPRVIPGNSPDGYSLIIMGDSHMRSLINPIRDRLESLNNIRQFIPLCSSGTLPFLDVDRLNMALDSPEDTARNWEELNAQRYALATEVEKPIVLLGGRLPLYVEPKGFNNLEGGQDDRKDQPKLVVKTNESVHLLNDAQLQEKIQQSVYTLLANGAKVALIYPIPEVGWNLPRKLIQLGRSYPQYDQKAILTASPLTTSYQAFKQWTGKSHELYDGIPDHPDLIRIYPELYFCDEDRCRTHDSEKAYYKDSHHLSYQGASILVEGILNKIQKKWDVGLSESDPDNTLVGDVAKNNAKTDAVIIRE